MATLTEGIAALHKLGIRPKIKTVSANPIRRRGALIGTIRNPTVSEGVRASAMAELEALLKAYPELNKIALSEAITPEPTEAEITV
jgi:hypothetical protein